MKWREVKKLMKAQGVTDESDMRLERFSVVGSYVSLTVELGPSPYGSPVFQAPAPPLAAGVEGSN